MTYIEPLMTITLVLGWIGVYFIGPSRGKRLLILSLLAASLISWPPCEYLFSRHLEARYPIRPFAAPAGIEAIVVLSSAVLPARFERPYPLPDGETFSRCQYAAWIYRNTPLPVLVSGGVGSARDPAVAVTMRELLLAAGIPESRIWMEDQSRSTHENAALSARILRQHGVRRIALAVDARSMLRAAACFRKEGIEVVPAPTRFRSPPAILEDWIPGWQAVRGNEITLHESLGLLWYWLHGWI